VAPVEQRFLIVALVEQGVGYGDGANRVVGVITIGFWTKQFKAGLWRRRKFEARAYYISNDCSQHDVLNVNG
jgi:hypothetical protein